MKLHRILALCACAGLLMACSDDEALGPPPPTASLRYVNAVADTIAMDFRVVDIVGDSPMGLNLGFRGFMNYQSVRAGSRKIRVFLSSTDQAIASKVMVDTSFTFEAGKSYSFIVTGFARTGSTPALHAVITTDEIPEVAANQVAVRAVNLAAGLGNIDVWAGAPTGNAATLPGTTPQWSNVAYKGATGYLTRAPGAFELGLTPAADGATILAKSTAPAGTAGTAAVNPIAGMGVGGTAMTAIILPRSVAGSTAASFTTPGVIFLLDRRPALTVR